MHFRLRLLATHHHCVKVGIPSFGAVTLIHAHTREE